MARVALAACAVTLAGGATPARALFLRGAVRRGALARACLSLLALACLCTAVPAMGGQSHLFQSEFTGSDTPAGSLGPPADKVDLRQSTGDVYVIDKANGVVDIFNGSGSYLSQVGSFSFGGDPDVAVDNSATASAGNFYVLPEFGPLSAYNSSGTLLYQLNGSTTPIGSFGDVCGTAVDSSGNVYVADYSNLVIQKFDSSGTYLTTFNLSFRPCDLKVDTDGTIYQIEWNTALHKLDSTGVDQGVIDSQSPRGVNVDPSTHHVYVVHDSSVIEYDSSGNMVSEFGDNLLEGSRGVAIDGASGNVYVSSNPAAGGEVVIFGPLVPVPDATTGNATNVMGTSATLNGHVDPAGAGNITDCHFEYGTDTTYGTSVPCVPATPIASPTDVSADISGLMQDTVYHFKLVVATSSPGTVSGADSTFQTTGPPIVVSEPASNVAETTATLNAMINPSGFDTTCVFEYVDDAAFQSTGYSTATSVPCVPADLGSGFSLVPASADVSGLASNTLYHFRVVATNSAGTTNGDDTTFHTGGPPVVTSASASSVTDASATLNAVVNPQGIDTTCVFQYVTDASFMATGYASATSVPCNPSDVGSGFTPQSVTGSATGLTPGTTYHFRAVATNAAGTVNGADTTFQTLVAFMVQVGSFGSAGSLASQFQSPIGVAAAGGKVYVADSGNARVQQFNQKGVFKAAWGWGVKDGQAKSEVCTNKKGCQAGIPGSGAGQFSNPTSIAVDSSKSSSKGSVYVGDAGNNVVLKFKASGKFVAAIDGTTTPQGHFVSLAGVAVDQNGNVWTVDAGTGNVDRFDSTGTFVQQFPIPSSLGSLQGGIAIDSNHGGALYLILNGNQSGTTVKFTLSGGSPTTIDPSGATALGLDPQSGNLFVDHGRNVTVYGPSGAQIGTLPSLGGGTTTGSQGLAYFSKSKSGRDDRLYAGDAGNDAVAIYGPRGVGAPFLSVESATHAGLTGETLSAGIVPLGRDTTCSFQYVDSATWLASGSMIPTNATSVPCSPADLGSSFVLQTGQALVAGLTVGTWYHFHVVATNSSGTVTGPDQTFQVGPGDWTPFYRCPVDDPTMLASDGVTFIDLCLASNSTHGSITIGAITTPTGNTNLQTGLVVNENTSAFTIVSPAGGAVLSDPTPAAGGITAIVSSAGDPSNFNLGAGLSIGVPIITLPIKIQLTGAGLGPTCFIGSEQNPIVLQPANLTLEGFSFSAFDPDGTPDPNGTIQAIVTFGSQGDSTFAVPAASGCTDDNTVNALLGLPSPSGANNLVLLNATSNLALPTSPFPNGVGWSTDWHTGFGGSPPTTTTTTTSSTTTTT